MAIGSGCHWLRACQVIVLVPRRWPNFFVEIGPRLMLQSLPRHCSWPLRGWLAGCGVEDFLLTRIPRRCGVEPRQRCCARTKEQAPPNILVTVIGAQNYVGEICAPMADLGHFIQFPCQMSKTMWGEFWTPATIPEDFQSQRPRGDRRLGRLELCQAKSRFDRTVEGNLKNQFQRHVKSNDVVSRLARHRTALEYLARSDG